MEDSVGRGPDGDRERKRARRIPSRVRGGRLESRNRAGRSDSSADGHGDIGAEGLEARGSTPEGNPGGGLHTCGTGGGKHTGVPPAGHSGARGDADGPEDGSVGGEDIVSDDDSENGSVGSEDAVSESDPETGSEGDEDPLSEDNLAEGSVRGEGALTKYDPKDGNLGSEDTLSDEEAEAADLWKPEGVFKGRRFSLVGEPEETWDRAVDDVMRALQAVGHSCIKRHDKLWVRRDPWRG